MKIQADDKMRYDVTAFDASPGQKISVTIKNIGTTPKFSMGHNFVMLDRAINTGNVQSAFLDKASTEASHDYVPPGDKGSARPFQTARTWGKRGRYIQRALHPGGVSLSLLVPRPLLPGHQGFHDSEIKSTTRKIDMKAKSTIALAIIIAAVGLVAAEKAAAQQRRSHGERARQLRRPRREG